MLIVVMSQEINKVHPSRSILHDNAIRIVRVRVIAFSAEAEHAQVADEHDFLGSTGYDCACS